MADIQEKFNVDHNPRPNEIALADFLKRARHEQGEISRECRAYP